MQPDLPIESFTRKTIIGCELVDETVKIFKKGNDLSVEVELTIDQYSNPDTNQQTKKQP